MTRTRPSRYNDRGSAVGMDVIQIDRARAIVEAGGGVKPDTTPRAAIPLAERFVRGPGGTSDPPPSNPIKAIRLQITPTNAPLRLPQPATINPRLRVCPRCKQAKDRVEGFYARKRGHSIGPATYCKACASQRAMEYRRGLPPEALAALKARDALAQRERRAREKLVQGDLTTASWTGAVGAAGRLAGGGKAW